MEVAQSGHTVEQIKELVISAAKRMADEDIEINKTMGKMELLFLMIMILS